MINCQQHAIKKSTMFILMLVKYLYLYTIKHFILPQTDFKDFLRIVI